MYEIIGPHSHVTYTKAEVIIFIVLAIWEGVWKAIALWKAGRNRQLIWFIAMIVLNTVGILEIVYLLFFQAKPDKSDKA